MRAGAGASVKGMMAGTDHRKETLQTGSVLGEPDAEICQGCPSINNLGRRELATAWPNTMDTCCYLGLLSKQVELGRVLRVSELSMNKWDSCVKSPMGSGVVTDSQGVLRNRK